MNVREYWTVLREDRLLIGGIVVVCVAIAAAVALLLPRTYTSNAVFYVAAQQTASSSTESYQGAQLSTERVKSYTELITGPRVAADASALLGGTPTADEIQNSISADAVAETVVLNVGVTRPTPEDAQLVGTAVTTAFTRLVNSIESTGQAVNRPVVSTELIYPPTMPIYPAGPGTTMLLAAGLLAGVVLGVGAALGRRALRRAVDSAEMLAEGLDTPLLAAVPALARRPERPALLGEPVAGRRGRAAAQARDRAAAVRRLRTAVVAGAGDRRCLVVTGVRSEQGTTTVAVDLAVALALAGESVVLVDADLQRPAVATALRLPEEPGLADALRAKGSSGGVVGVQRFPAGSFDVLTAGSAVERPGEVWGSPAGAAVLTALRSTYSWVLLDAEPLSGSPAALDLARLADGVVVVARRGSARPEDLDAAAAGLRTVDATAIGAVFTFAVDVPEAPVETRKALPAGRKRSAAEPARPVTPPAAPASPAAPEPVAASAPVATAPVASEPEAAKPEAAKPVAASAPVATEPVAAAPVAAEPVASEPVAAEPATAKRATPIEDQPTSSVAPAEPEPAAAEPELAPVVGNAELAAPEPAAPLARTAEPGEVTGRIPARGPAQPVVPAARTGSEPVPAVAPPSAPAAAEPASSEPTAPAVGNGSAPRRRGHRRVTSSWSEPTVAPEPAAEDVESRSNGHAGPRSNGSVPGANGTGTNGSASNGTGTNGHGPHARRRRRAVRPTPTSS
ncbi:Wzz/FepE/Etk N-terminal domain-containing protein [Actinomycetospora corticicola]|uniref:Capsular polysaccharide biosynthesis protein/Mrp family chromosome partitioning ATPase n=1 Tax=Actinomycetospora corticicola TaxID=663602 RepID=A0A7Y9DS06_9PSEU|nr:capsular polysaccharide biosynthesis protein/Mrp family chromosome partitioning ATPase [Actinomycetospora corticicola]